MNLADVIILILVILIVAAVVLSALKKRKSAKQDTNHKCSGCAYKGFCGKPPKQ